MEPFCDYNNGAVKAVKGGELINMSSEHEDIKKLFQPLNNGLNYPWYLWGGNIRIPKRPPPALPTPGKPTPGPPPAVRKKPNPIPCINPSIIKRIENGIETSFNGCDATMANCSEIFKNPNGTDRNSVPNLKSYFYDTNPVSPGCRLRCPGMTHDLSRDTVDPKTGHVSNYCSIAQAGQRGCDKRKKRKGKEKNDKIIYYKII